jgi:hypothetical protein
MKRGRATNELIVRLDDETLARARKRAGERNAGVAEFLLELLRKELERGDEYEAAYATWRARAPFALKGPPQRYPAREELYDRPLLRRR